MVATLVQSNDGTSASVTNPSSAAWGATLAIGNTVIMTIVNDSGSANYITSVTGGGSTWTRRDSQVDGQGSDIELWEGIVTSAVTTAITFGFSQVGATRIVWLPQEWSGLTATPFDRVSTVASGSSTAPLSTGTGTLAQADSVIVGSVGWTTGTSTFTAGSGYSGAIDDGGTTDSARFGGQESKVVAATTTQTASATLGTSRPWGAIASAWKIAAAGGPITRPVPAAQSPAVARSSRW